MTNVDLRPVLDKWFASSKPAEGSDGVESTLAWVRRHVRKAVMSRLVILGGNWPKQDVDDICQNALGNLAKELRKNPDPETSEPPEYPKAYLNTVAKNACHDAFRERNPEWFSLAGRIQYRAEKYAEEEKGNQVPRRRSVAAERRSAGSKPFVIWSDGKHHVCGFIPDRGKAPLLDRLLLDGIDEHLRPESDRSLLSLEVIVTDILNAAGRPLLLEALVTLALVYTGGEWVEESLSEEVIEGVELIDTISAIDPDPEALLLLKHFAIFLWNEVMLLPEGQRQVTGLNLEAVVHLSLDEFLQAGAGTEQDFHRLIQPVRSGDVRRSLPLPDPAIAGLLQMLVDRVQEHRLNAKKRIRRRCIERGKKF